MKEPEYPITKMFPWRPLVSAMVAGGDYVDLPKGFRAKHTHLMQTAMRRTIPDFTLTGKSLEGGGIRIWRVK